MLAAAAVGGYAISERVVGPQLLISVVVAAIAGLFILTRTSPGGWLIALGFATGTFVAEAAVAAPVASGGGFNLSPTKVGPLVLLALGTAMLWTRPNRSSHATLGSVGRWLAAYIFWMLVCSALGQYPTSAVLRTAQAAVPLVAVLAFLESGLPRRTLLWLAGGAAAVHVLIGVVDKGTAYAYTDRVSGLLVMNAYTFAAGAVFVLGLGCWRAGIGRSRLPFVAMMLLGCWGVSVSRGRTGALACIAAVAVAILLPDASLDDVARRRQRAARFALLLVPIVVLVFGSTFSTWFVRHDSHGLRTLSDRTTVWHTAWEMVGDRPLVGYGPGALRTTGSTIDEVLGRSNRGLGTAHNSFVEAMVSGGFPGALLWLGFMAAFARLVWRSRQRTFAAPIFAALAVFSMALAMMAGFGMGWYVAMGLLAVVAPELPLDDGGADRARGEILSGTR